MSPNSIEQIMHISLCHIRKESEKLILQNANRTGVYCMIAFRLKKYREYIVRTYYEKIDTPDDIQTCLKYAKDKGCEWVYFSKYAEPIQDLPRLRTEDEIQ